MTMNKMRISKPTREKEREKKKLAGYGDAQLKPLSHYKSSPPVKTAEVNNTAESSHQSISSHSKLRKLGAWLPQTGLTSKHKSPGSPLHKQEAHNRAEYKCGEVPGLS